jgi:glycosyltransferase involved in cell wall biosynthesis
MKLSIVIPAYNEEKRIGPVLRDYYEFFRKTIPNFEIIAVIEGNDGTLNLVKEFAKKNKKIKFIYSRERLGKGRAVLKGFKEADGDIIGFTDADGSVNADSFYKLIKELENYDYVIGSRKLPDSKIIKNRPLIQRFGSFGFNLLSRIILGLSFKDTQCGAKVFKNIPAKYLIEKVKSTDWAFDAELLYLLKKARFKIREVPVDWDYKRGGCFNFNNFFWKLVPNMFTTLIKIRFAKN